MFELTAEPGAAERTSGLFVLPAAVGQTQIGDPIEDVAWFRDEMANVVWAVEHRVASPFGGHIDRAEAIRQTGTVMRQHVDVDIDEADSSTASIRRSPSSGSRLVPVLPASASSGATELELRPITPVRFRRSGGDCTAPQRSVGAASPTRIAEEEVLATGP